jgi:hypothetical protein
MLYDQSRFGTADEARNEIPVEIILKAFFPLA